MECSKNSSEREGHSNTGLPQKTRKISNNLTYHLKELEKEEQTKPKISRKKEIKIKGEINKIVIKKQKKVSKTKSWFFERVNTTDKPSHQAHQEEKRENPNKQNKK